MGTKLLKLVVTVFILLGMVKLYAGDPTWVRTNYTNSTTFVGYISLSYEGVSEGDWIGAFVGDECRMVAQLFSHDDSLYVSSVLHGGDIQDPAGTSGEEVSFKLWKSASNAEVDLPGVATTNPGGSLYLFEIAAPILEATSITINGEPLEGFDPETESYTVNVEAVPTVEDIVVETPEARVEAIKEIADNKATITITATGVKEEDQKQYIITFVTEDKCEGVVVSAPELTIDPICQDDDFPTINQDGILLFADADMTTALTLPYTFTDAGTIYAIAVNGDNCKSDAVEVTLNVIETPAVPEVTDQEICQGEAFDAFAVAEGVTIYLEEAGTTALEGNKPTEGGTYWAIAANGSCQSEAVAVNAFVKDGETHEPAPIEVCFSADPIVPAEGASFTYEGNTIESFDPSAFEAGEYIITELISAEEGCGSSGNLVITVVKPSTPTLEKTDITIKIGEAIPALQVSNTETVLWTNTEGEEVSTDNPFTPEISNDTEASYTFNVVNTETENCYSETVPVTIAISSCGLAKPTISIVEGENLENADVAICEGTKIQANGEEAASWKWILPNGEESTENEIAPTEEGTYSVTQTTEEAGCESPALTFNVTFITNEAIVFELQPTVETNKTVALTATPAGGVFTLNGEEITEFSSAEEGEYIITYTLEGECGTTTATATINVKAITEVDKTALEAAIVNAENVDIDASFTSISKALAFTNALSDAKEISSKEDATQAEVDAATEALLNAMPVDPIVDKKPLEDAIAAANATLTANELEKDANDVAALQAAIDAANEALATVANNDEVAAEVAKLVAAEDLFNELNIAALENAITEGNAIVDKAETEGYDETLVAELTDLLSATYATQPEVDQLADDILAKIQEITGTPVIVTIELEDAIKVAEELVSNNPKNKNEDEVAELNTAAATAKEALENVETQEDVTAAIDAIQAAIDAYNTIDYSELQSAIDAAVAKLAEIEASGKDYVGVEELSAAYNAALDLTNSQNQGDINTATADLVAKIAAAKESTTTVDTAALASKIEEAEALLADIKKDESKYVAETVENLEAALEAAKIALTGSQDAITAATSTLDNAIEGVEEVPAPLDYTLIDAAIFDTKIKQITVATECGASSIAYTDITAEIATAEAIKKTATTQKELDDKASYLSSLKYTCSVGTDPLEEVAVCPTVTASTVTAKGLENVTTILVVGIDGKVIDIYNPTGNTEVIDLSGKSSGEIIIKFYNADGNEKAVKVIKQ